MTSSFERVSPVGRLNQNRVSSPILSHSHSSSPLGSPLRTSATQSPIYRNSPVNGVHRPVGMASPLHSPSASPAGIIHNSYNSSSSSFNNQSSVDTSSNVRGN